VGAEHDAAEAHRVISAPVKPTIPVDHILLYNPGVLLEGYPKKYKPSIAVFCLAPMFGNHCLQLGYQSLSPLLLLAQRREPAIGSRVDVFVGSRRV
jgi:hypothetical protein